jgi:orsellinic acid C2-O-methyltransferase
MKHAQVGGVRSLDSTSAEMHFDDAGDLVGLISGAVMCQAICCAVELGVADRLSSGAASAEELARQLACHAPSLRRLMRALVSVGVCEEDEDGKFVLTRKGLLLQAQTYGSLRSWILWYGRRQWVHWGKLDHSVRTGESARGRMGFGHLECDPDTADDFNRAMRDLTTLVAAAILRAYDFADATRIVDVGGGYGTLLGAILVAHPRLTGIVYDRAHAAEGAKAYLGAMRLAHRCEFVDGDFFASLPRDADTYLLKSILHDWSDGPGAEILRNCRAAIPANGRLLIIERVMPEHGGSSPMHQAVVQSDLNMLVGPGGRERTQAEYRVLLEGTGFELVRILPADLGYSLLMATPA